MKGFPLQAYNVELHELPPRTNPQWCVRDVRKKILAEREHIEEVGHRFDIDPKWSRRKVFLELCGRMPIKRLKQFSFEDLARIYCSRTVQMERTVEKYFESSARHDLVRKIRNSMWHWGWDRRRSVEWNTMVRAYRGIAQFDFGVPGFTPRLDYTSWFNERGHARCSRTYLDGVFGFLIYDKAVHVMTIGFSIASGDRLLVTQVQLAKPKGNRFLFKLPVPYVDHALMQLKKAFPEFTHYLVDGVTLNAKYVGDCIRYCDTVRSRMRNDLENKRRGYAKWKDDFDYHKRDYRASRTHLSKLREARERMKRVYSTLSCFQRVADDMYERNKLIFHRVEFIA